MELNPISELNNLCQKLRLSLPTFNETMDYRSGEFMCSVNVNGLTGSGCGLSKKVAKTKAVRNLFDTNYSFKQIITDTRRESEPQSQSQPISIQSDCTNWIGGLFQYCQQRRFPHPIFKEYCTSGPSHSPIFEVQCHLNGIVEAGKANKKKDAEQQAAKKVLQHLQSQEQDIVVEHNFEIIDAIPINEYCKRDPNSSSVQCLPILANNNLQVIDDKSIGSAINQGADLNDSTTEGEENAVSVLFEMCQERRYDTPTFNIISQSGPSNRPTFLVECVINDQKEQGECFTKKGAQRKAAAKLLTKLREKDLIPMSLDFLEIIEEYECPIRKFKKAKRSDIKYNSSKVMLNDRHNFFKAFSDVKKINVSNIIASQMNTPIEKLPLVCQELKLNYQISPIPNHPNCYYRFILNDESYDCVLSDTLDNLPAYVLEYLSTMLGI